MSRTSALHVEPTVGSSLLPMLVWPAMVTETLMEMQRAQIEAMSTWQRSLTEFAQERWDEWIAHWGGGVPLDG